MLVRRLPCAHIGPGGRPRPRSPLCFRAASFSSARHHHTGFSSRAWDSLDRAYSSSRVTQLKINDLILVYPY